MERSDLLSHPPSLELDPDDGEQMSAGQSCPSPTTPGALGAGEPEFFSLPEQERSPRSEQWPAGCVDMVHTKKHISSVCLTQSEKLLLSKTVIQTKT